MDLVNSFLYSSEVTTLERIFWAMWVSIGFAILFNSPKRCLWAVALMAISGYSTRELVLSLIPAQTIVATFLGACVVGLLGVFFAHMVHTPPIVFTVPAVINMIPGRLGYEFMMSLIELMTISDGEIMQFTFFFDEVLTKGLKTGFTLLSLGVGLISPLLFFKTMSVKDRNLTKIIKDRIFK